MDAAKQALTEIILDAKDRQARWGQLQALLGFSLRDGPDTPHENGNSLSASSSSKSRSTPSLRHRAPSDPS